MAKIVEEAILSSLSAGTLAVLVLILVSFNPISLPTSTLSNIHHTLCLRFPGPSPLLPDLALSLCSATH